MLQHLVNDHWDMHWFPGENCWRAFRPREHKKAIGKTTLVTILVTYYGTCTLYR
jgi:hypothetical protein